MPAKKESKPVPEMEIEGLGLARPGMKVKHPIPGKGVIEELALWADGSSKWLAPEYAKLKPS